MAEMVVKIEGATPVPGPSGSGSLPVTPSVVPALPRSSAVLHGTAVTNGVIITIPAGQTWYGYVTCSGSYHATTQSQAVIGVNTTGTGVVPPTANKILELRLSIGTPAASAEEAAYDSMVTPYFAVYAGSTNATLTLAVGLAQNVTASAYGWIV